MISFEYYKFSISKEQGREHHAKHLKTIIERMFINTNRDVLNQKSNSFEFFYHLVTNKNF